MNDPQLYVPLQKSPPLPASIGTIAVDVICAALTILFMVKAFSLAATLAATHIALVLP